MNTKTDWNRYGYCDTCEQHARVPCLDLRYARHNRVFRRDTPHPRRERLA